MHYANGREAKNGDKVILLPAYPKDADGRSTAIPVIGILYDAQVGNDHCNGKLAVVKPNDPCPNLKECLHLDDVMAVLDGQLVLDTSKPVSTPTEEAE